MAPARSKCRHSSGLRNPHGEDVGDATSANHSAQSKYDSQLPGGGNGWGAIKSVVLRFSYHDRDKQIEGVQEDAASKSPSPISLILLPNVGPILE